MFTKRENNEKNGFGKGAQFSHSKCINVHMTENALLGLSIDCGSGFLKTSKIEKIFYVGNVYTFITHSGTVYRAIAENAAEKRHLENLYQVISKVNGISFHADADELEKVLKNYYGFFGDGRCFFIQHNGATCGEMPNQGIKLHISFKDYEEYSIVLSWLVPLMNDCDMTYKVVIPSLFGEFQEGVTSQQGKYITIYPCRCDFQRFYEHAFELLSNGDVIPVLGDAHMFGRVFGRYGAMRGRYVFDANGNMYPDDRSRAYPAFMSGVSLSDFISLYSR